MEKSHNDEVWIVQFSPDGLHLASIAKNRSLIIYEFKSNSLIKKIKKEKIHDKEINCLNWNPQSTLVATASADKTSRIWNIKGELVISLDGHSDMVFSILWHPK